MPGMTLESLKKHKSVSIFVVLIKTFFIFIYTYDIKVIKNTQMTKVK